MRRREAIRSSGKRQQGSWWRRLAEEVSVWSARPVGEGGEGPGGMSKEQAERGRLRRLITRGLLSLNATALAPRAAQSMPRGKAGQGGALVMAAGGVLVGHSGLSGGNRMERNRSLPWASRRWP